MIKYKKDKIVSTVEKDGMVTQYSQIESNYLVEYQKKDETWVEIGRLSMGLTDGKSKPA